MKTSISTHLDDIVVMVMATEDKEFGNRLLSPRKEQGWPQPELGKKIGTSGAIIGRYECGDITPVISQIPIEQFGHFRSNSYRSQTFAPDANLGNCIFL